MKKKNLLEKAIRSFLSGSIFSGEQIECKAPCVFEAIDCCLILFQESSAEAGKSDSPLSRAESLINEISSDIEKSATIEQKYKDGLLLAKIKISLAQVSQNNDFCQRSIELIEDITSPDVLSEVCDFVIDKKAPQETILALLERAKKIDKMNSSAASADNSIVSLTASLLYQLVLHSETLEESRKNYSLVLDFVVPENASLMSFAQLQFFMSRAWNIGVNCAQSFRLKDANWWLQNALNILNLNDELKALYADELSEKYSKFIHSPDFQIENSE